MSDEKEMQEVPAEVEETASAPESMANFYRDPNAPIITIRKLLEAGVHFGHQTRRWNPKMGRFVYGARNGIYIIDLTKTVVQVNASYAKLLEIVKAGGKVLFVGTKETAKQIVLDEATRSGSFYINNRWLGGTLTNFRTIQSRIKRLKELQDMEKDGEFERLPKKEVAQLRKQLEKLSRNLEGIKEMRRPPAAIIVDDPTLEHNAIAEARKLGVITFAICDTNDDPDLVDYAIPSNNDATSALKLLMSVLSDAIVESKGGVTEIAYVVEENAKEATMKDAIVNADLRNEERKAAIRAARAEKEARYKKMQEERAARFAAKKAAEKAEEEKPASEDKPKA